MKVSIITVCYNSSSTIKETIDSVNSQSYKNIEHIFIDGISIDNTIELIKANSKIKYNLISEKDNGIYDAMNKGIKIANGEIIFILNSDDILFSNNTIKSVVNFFKLNNVDMIYGHIYLSDLTNIRSYVRNWKVTKFLPGSFTKGWHPAHPGFVVKKHIYSKHGLFKLDLPVAADFELMLRFFEKKGCSSKLYDNYISVMRMGGDSTNIRGIIKGNRDIKKAFNINNIRLPTNYFFKRYYNKFLQKFDVKK